MTVKELDKTLDWVELHQQITSQPFPLAIPKTPNALHKFLFR